MTMYWVLSAFTSSPISLLATTKVGKVLLFHRPQKPLGSVEELIYSFITSALDGDGWSASLPSHLNPREKTATLFTGGWVGPRDGLDGCRKSRPSRIRSPDLANTEASVFFFIVCMLLSSIQVLTLSAWFPIIWTRTLTNIFLISVQLEAHSSSCRLTRKHRTTIYPSDFCRCILSVFYYTVKPALNGPCIKRNLS